MVPWLTCSAGVVTIGIPISPAPTQRLANLYSGSNIKQCGIGSGKTLMTARRIALIAIFATGLPGCSPVLYQAAAETSLKVIVGPNSEYRIIVDRMENSFDFIDQMHFTSLTRNIYPGDQSNYIGYFVFNRCGMASFYNVSEKNSETITYQLSIRKPRLSFSIDAESCYKRFKYIILDSVNNEITID
ncbi:MAG: hypothetical protein RIA71_14875 [Oceanicaulis sp.]